MKNFKIVPIQDEDMIAIKAVADKWEPHGLYSKKGDIINATDEELESLLTGEPTPSNVYVQPLYTVDKNVKFNQKDANLMFNILEHKVDVFGQHRNEFVAKILSENEYSSELSTSSGTVNIEFKDNTFTLKETNKNSSLTDVQTLLNWYLKEKTNEPTMSF